MKSQIPKVLHDLCGRPMVAWPVLAAQEAGAERGRRRRLARRRHGRRPARRRATSRSRRSPTAPAARSPRRCDELGDGPGRRPQRRRPAGERRSASRTSSGRTRRRGAAATMATTILDDARATAASCATATARVERVVETKVGGDATAEELAIHEVNTGIYCFDARRAARRAPAPGDRQRPGRALPARGARAPARRRRDGRRPRRRRPRAGARRQRPRRARRGRARSPSGASSSATCAPGVTIVDPARRPIDATRDDRRRHDDRARLRPARGDDDRRGRHGRAAHDGHRLLDRGGLAGPARLPARGAGRTTASASARSPTCAPAPSCARARRSGRSSRSRTPTSARARRSRTSATSATPTSGGNSNLGAATITANYDGRAKHRTTIGDDVRSSVDVTLRRAGDASATAR